MMSRKTLTVVRRIGQALGQMKEGDEDDGDSSSSNPDHSEDDVETESSTSGGDSHSVYQPTSSSDDDDDGTVKNDSNSSGSEGSTSPPPSQQEDSSGNSDDDVGELKLKTGKENDGGSEMEVEDDLRSSCEVLLVKEVGVAKKRTPLTERPQRQGNSRVVEVTYLTPRNSGTGAAEEQEEEEGEETHQAEVPKEAVGNEPELKCEHQPYSPQFQGTQDSSVAPPDLSLSEMAAKVESNNAQPEMIDLAEEEDDSAPTLYESIAGLVIGDGGSNNATQKAASETHPEENDGKNKKKKRKKKTKRFTKLAKKAEVCPNPNPKWEDWSVTNHKGEIVTDPKYTFSCDLKEDHGEALFGCKFHLNLGQGQPLIFATVGSNRVTVYECVPDGSIKLVMCFADADKKEKYYACAWSDTDDGKAIIAAAGLKGIISIFSPANPAASRSLTGHTSSINDLMFHPKDNNILATASKDHSLRLWNVKTGACAIKFGGADGHRDEVLSVDINLTGTKLLSCGMDHSIRVWNLDKPKIRQMVRKSYAFKFRGTAFSTWIQNIPDFVTRNVHANYIDCGKWFGQYIISKSCENELFCWKGGDEFQSWKEIPYVAINEENTTGGEVSILAELKLDNCEIWYIRFALDFWKQTLALGNKDGQIYVYDLKVSSPRRIKETILSHPGCQSIIRQTAFSRDGSVLICVCDDSTIWRWNIRKEVEEVQVPVVRIKEEMEDDDE